MFLREVQKHFPLIRCCDDTSSKKKRFVKKYWCWFIHEKPNAPYKTMLERLLAQYLLLATYMKLSMIIIIIIIVW